MYMVDGKDTCAIFIHLHFTRLCDFSFITFPFLHSFFSLHFPHKIVATAEASVTVAALMSATAATERSRWQ